MTIFLGACLVMLLLVMYWLHVNAVFSGDYFRWQLVILPLILAVLISLQRADPAADGSGPPVFIAIAADVSLSMGTAPEPRAYGDIGTRLERAQRALLPLITELGSSTRPIMLAVTAFTSKAQTIVAWDDDPGQIHEVISYVLATEMLTEPGSDLGVALKGAELLFNSLPSAYRGTEQGKFLIVVSDGEQNVANSDSAAALGKLRESGVKIVSLHVGLSDTPEGLPAYDDSGSFIGFDEVGGQLFSVPDPGAMALLAGTDPEQGIFVKAESNEAAEAMMEFVGQQIAGPSSASVRARLILVLWGLIMIVMLRYV